MDHVDKIINDSDYFSNKEMIKTIYVNNYSGEKNKQIHSNINNQESILDESFMKSIFNQSKLNHKSIPNEISNKSANFHQFNEFADDYSCLFNQNQNSKVSKINDVDNHFDKLIENIEDSDLKSNLKSIENINFKLTLLINLVNQLMTDNKKLKNKLEKSNEEKNINLKIIKSESFDLAKDNIDIITDPCNKINLDDLNKNDSVNDLEKRKSSSLFNINQIIIKNKVNSNDTQNNNYILNSDTLIRDNFLPKKFEFALCDNFLQTKQFIKTDSETEINLRIYNKSKKVYKGKIKIKIDNISEIQEKFEKVIKIEDFNETVKLNENEFVEFKLIIQSSFEEVNKELKISCDFYQKNKLSFIQKFFYSISTSNLANELNANVFFEGLSLNISDEAKTFFYLILKNGKIFMERDEYISFLNSYEFDYQKITDILL